MPTFRLEGVQFPHPRWKGIDGAFRLQIRYYENEEIPSSGFFPQSLESWGFRIRVSQQAIGPDPERGHI